MNASYNGNDNPERFVADRSIICVPVDYGRFNSCEIHAIISFRLPAANFTQSVPSEFHDIDGNVAAQSTVIEFDVSGESSMETL